MSDIYVHGPNHAENNYASMGLVGALTPTEVRFTETANGESILTLKHPIDEFERYRTLERGNILVAKVPVRIVPEIQNGSCATTIWQYRVKQDDELTSWQQRAVYSEKVGGWHMGQIMPGELITVVEKPEEYEEVNRWKVRSNVGTGWVDSSSFDLDSEISHEIPDESQAIEEVQSSWKCIPQQFRIYETKKGINNVEVTARHISYDLLKNVTSYKSAESVTLQTALSGTDGTGGILGNCYAPHIFKAYTNVSNESPGLFYCGKNVIEAFLDPEEGICKKFDVNLIRDNYDLYFLHDPGMNRGVRIQYGKNLTGIDYHSSDEEVATRIVPVGKKEDGSVLFLSDVKEEQYIDSVDQFDGDGNVIQAGHIDDYPIVHVYWLECENCTVGETDDYGGVVTESIARARMRSQALNLLKEKCDEPTVSIDVQFVNLGDSEEYKQFKDLESCFLYDYVIVQYGKQNIDLTVRISSIEWNCLLDRMESMTVGEVGITQVNTGITTWQIPSGFSGSKIASNTVSGSSLKNDVISTRHLQAESVNAEAIQAGAVNADKIAANSLDTLILQAYLAKIRTLNADNIMADTIGAEIARIERVVAGVAEFDKAEVKNLVANLLFVEDANETDVLIRNLRVAYSQMVYATINTLVIRGSDGHYYRLDVDRTTDSLTYSDVTDDISQAEILAGKTDSGRAIVETEMTVDDLSASTFRGIEAIITKINAATIDVDKLFAREAFIDRINTTDIRSNSYIQLMVGDAVEEASAWRIEITSTTDVLHSEMNTAILTAHLYYGSSEVTDDYPSFMFSWRRSGDNNESDKNWNSSHKRMKSVTITEGSVKYNAAYHCDFQQPETLQANDDKFIFTSDHKTIMVLEEI